MRLNTLIYKAVRALLRLNARLYSRGASHEVCRDLMGEFGGYQENAPPAAFSSNDLCSLCGAHLETEPHAEDCEYRKSFTFVALTEDELNSTY